jgi:hypothetical protein
MEDDSIYPRKCQEEDCCVCKKSEKHGMEGVKQLRSACNKCDKGLNGLCLPKHAVSNMYMEEDVSC